MFNALVHPSNTLHAFLRLHIRRLGPVSARDPFGAAVQVAGWAGCSGQPTFSSWIVQVHPKYLNRIGVSSRVHEGRSVSGAG
jgi:hypothetical protein